MRRFAAWVALALLAGAAPDDADGAIGLHLGHIAGQEPVAVEFGLCFHFCAEIAQKQTRIAAMDGEDARLSAWQDRTIGTKHGDAAARLGIAGQAGCCRARGRGRDNAARGRLID